ncbi:MAG: helix-turn-helix transcriptional regulator [Clostridiaceae bacterium]|nr:helix-turn-helix transcriptional regulator [Clostridiaceae bacterium]
MSTMGERIADCITASGLTKTAFATKINVSQPFISRLASGDKVPSDRTIADICREFNVSEHWLRTGEGDMFIQLSEDADFIRVMTEIQVSDDELIKSILMAYWDLPDDKKAAIRDLVDGILKRYSKKENAGQ